MMSLPLPGLKQVLNKGVAIARIKPKLPRWSRYRTIIKTRSNSFTFEHLRENYIYLRSIKALIDRTEDIGFIGVDILNKLDYVFTKTGFASILDVQIITHSLTKIGLGPDKTLEEKKQLLKLTKTLEEKEDSKVLEPLLDKRLGAYLKNGAKQSRSLEWKFRVQRAMHEAVIINKWYPLFGTYTVDPKRLPAGCLTRNDLWTKTPAWDRFIQMFKSHIAASLGYGRKPSKWPKTKTFFQYFAIIEHGKSLEHPHIHVIFLCKNIPQLWKVDPNNNDPINSQFNIPAASAIWNHGIQKVTQAIFIEGSPFIDELKWKIPRKYNEEADTYTAIKVGDASAVAGYIAKYMTKGGKQWSHRVKATKNLGLTMVRKTLAEVKCIPILKALAERPNEYQTAFKLQRQTSCPIHLLRRMSKQELERRWHTSATELGEQSLYKRWTKEPSTFYIKLIRLVSNGLRLWKMTHEQRYNQYSLIIGEVDRAAHCKPIIDDVLKWLDRTFEPMVSCEPYIRLQEKRA